MSLTHKVKLMCFQNGQCISPIIINFLRLTPRPIAAAPGRSFIGFGSTPGMHKLRR